MSHCALIYLFFFFKTHTHCVCLRRDLLGELSARESKHLREKQRALTEQGLDVTAGSPDPDNRLTFVEQEREKATKGKTKGRVLDYDQEDDEDGPRLFQASKLDADDDNDEDDDRGEPGEIVARLFACFLFLYVFGFTGISLHLIHL